MRPLPTSQTLLAPLLVAILIAMGGPVASRAEAAPTITARVQPNQIPLGQDARLVVTISGATNAPTPRPAPVPGLDIQNLGQTMSMQFVNGSMTTEVTNTFLVRPTRVGEFEIPAISVSVGDDTLSSRPMTLHVFDSSRVPQVKRTKPRTTESRGTGADPTADVDGEPRIVLLEVTGVPDREIFVGEVLPVEIRLYVREGTRVTEATPPTLVGSGFTLSRASDAEPKQQRVRLSGGIYTRLTFPAALSPITAGEIPLEASLSVTARIPKKVARQRRRFDDPFFDSFFDSFAYRAVDQKIPVNSKPTTVRVARLPVEGRPESFTGGVGRFTLEASAEPTSVAVGDPITLRIATYGQGNFDRLQFPTLDDSDDWKTYDPTSTFKSEDALGLSGRKSFEQAILPLRAGVREVPGLQLTYFDPEQRAYVTLSTEPVPIEVRAAPAGHRPRPIGQTGPLGLDTFELAPNKIEIGTLHGDLRPAATRAWFLALQLLPVLGVGVALWWGRRRRHRALDPSHVRNRRLERELKALTERMDGAVRSGDVQAFFEAARRALQEQLAGIEGDVAAKSLTPPEMERRLSNRPELRDRVSEIFAAADALAYGGSRQDGAELQRRRDDIADVLAELGKDRSR